MKKTIRLTESMFRQMIRNVLTETMIDYPSASAFRADYPGPGYNEEPSEEDIINSLNQEYPQYLKDRDNELSWAQIDATESPSEDGTRRFKRIYNRNAKQFGGETNQLKNWTKGLDNLDDVGEDYELSRSIDEAISKAIRKVLR